MTVDQAAVRADMEAWLHTAVIGLNLCPFAKAPTLSGQVRFTVSHATSEAALLADLRAELRFLHEADPEACETTLLIHPAVLTDFRAYNRFLDDADALLAELGLRGELQIASFHPRYQFAGTRPSDITNYSNRAPHPTLHLLRERSVERATGASADASHIYDANRATLRKLGIAGWHALWKTTP